LIGIILKDYTLPENVNDAFRVLLNVPRWTSASSLFVAHGVDTFCTGTVNRKGFIPIQLHA